MNELMKAFAEARFGKSGALADPTTAGVRRFIGAGGELPENIRVIRRKIEEATREAERAREKARELIEYAHGKATEPRRPPGLLSFFTDLGLSVIPGLTPAASADGMSKEGQEEYEDSRIGPAVHLGLGGLGAGLGVAVQRGALSQEARRKYLQNVIARATPGGEKELMSFLRTIVPKDVLARVGAPAGRGASKAMKMPAAEAARWMASAQKESWLRKMLGVPGRAISRAMGKPIEKPLRLAKAEIPVAREAIGTLMQKARAAGVKLPWKGGAAIGAIALSAPFILRNLFRRRTAYRRGGFEAERAARQAEALLRQTERAEQWRAAQLGHLMRTSPDKARLLPFLPV